MDNLVCELGESASAIEVGTPIRKLRSWTRAKRFRVHVDGVERFSGRAPGLVIATGEFLDGLDINPRSHPSDGLAEVIVPVLRRAEREEFVRRCQTGSQFPHPDLLVFRGTTITVSGRGFTVSLDGVSAGRARVLNVRIAHKYSSNSAPAMASDGSKSV